MRPENRERVIMRAMPRMMRGRAVFSILSRSLMVVMRGRPSARTRMPTMGLSNPRDRLKG